PSAEPRLGPAAKRHYVRLVRLVRTPAGPVPPLPDVVDSRGGSCRVFPEDRLKAGWAGIGLPSVITLVGEREPRILSTILHRAFSRRHLESSLPQCSLTNPVQQSLEQSAHPRSHDLARGIPNECFGGQNSRRGGIFHNYLDKQRPISGHCHRD